MKAEIEKLDDQKPCCGSTQKKMEAENEHLGYELSFPKNGLDNLEWLSQFVEEDSCSGYSLMIGKLPEKKNQSVTENLVQGKSCFTGPVKTKPRTKRGRMGARVWSLTSSSTFSTSSSTNDDEDPFDPTGFITALSTWSLEPYPVFFQSSISLAGQLAELERVLETTSSASSSSYSSVVVGQILSKKVVQIPRDDEFDISTGVLENTGDFGEDLVS